MRLSLAPLRDARCAVPQVIMVIDAARAAHIPGVGGFGSGFLSDPTEVKAKLAAAGVRLACTESVIGYRLLENELAPPSSAGDALAFPNALGPLGLQSAACVVSLETAADGSSS